MSACIERCPRCIVPQMVARTNGFGNVYLECPGCGYYDAVKRKPDPLPTHVYRDESGKLRRRYGRVKGNKIPTLKGGPIPPPVRRSA